MTIKQQITAANIPLSTQHCEKVSRKHFAPGLHALPAENAEADEMQPDCESSFPAFKVPTESGGPPSGAEHDAD